GIVNLGGNVTTSAAQTYTSNVVLTSDVTLNGVSIDIQGNVDSKASTHKSLTIIATDFSLAGGFGLKDSLQNLSINATNGISLGGAITTIGTQTYTGAVTLIADTTLIGTNITLNNTIDGASGSTSYDLTITGSGDTIFDDAIGNARALGNLTVNGGGKTFLNGGIVKTAGTQTYSDAVELGADTTLTGSVVSFLNTVLGDDGTTKFALNVVGNAILGSSSSASDAITGLASLDVTGTTLIETATLTSAGTQRYHGDVTLGTATTLTTTNSATTFDAALASDTGEANDLTISTGTGNILVQGAIGASGGAARIGNLVANAAGTKTFASTIQAVSLTTQGAGIVKLGGNVTTSAAQAYNSNVVLTSDVTLRGTNIAIQGDVDSTALTHKSLTIVATGFSLAGGFGPTDSLQNLSITATNGISLGGAITTVGTQTYTGAATLTADTALTGAGISFVNTLNGAKALTITDTATTTFGGAVGGTAPLTSLLVNGAGTTRINGGGVETVLAQTYSNAVVLGAATTLTGSTINLYNALTGAFALQIVGDAEFGQSTGSRNDTLSLASLSVSGDAAFHLQSITTTGAQSYGGNVDFNADADLTAVGFSVAGTWNGAYDVTVGAGTGTIFVEDAIGTTLNPVGNLSFTATGTKTFKSTIDAVSLATAGTGIVNLGGNVTTSAAQTYTSNIVLTSDVTLNGTNIAIQGDVDSDADLTPRSLTIVAPDFSLSGRFGAAHTLNNLSITSTNGISLGGAITTVGTQTYTGAVRLTANTSLTTTNSAVTFSSTLNSTSGSSARNLTVTAGAGAVSFAKAVGAGTGGALGAVTLVSAGDVTFSKALTAASFTQSAGTGETRFEGTTNLAGAFAFTGNNLTINAALTTGGAMTIANAGVFATGANGAINVTGDVTETGNGINSLAANITATGDISFAKTITLTADVLLNGADITLAQTINSDTTPRALTVTGSGNILFGQTIGGGGGELASLTVNGAAQVNGGYVGTAGAQLYRGAVVLGANTSFVSTADGITFSAALDADSTARNLTITAGSGDVLFDAAIGATGPLGDVVLISAHDVTLARTVGAKSFTQSAGTGLTTFNGATTLTGGFIFLGENLIVNALIDAGDDVVMGHTGTFTTTAAGDIITDGEFTQSGSGTNRLAGDVSSNGAITFQKTVTLTGNVSLTSLGHDVTFISAVASDANALTGLSITAGAGDVTFVQAVTLGGAFDVTGADLTLNDALSADGDVTIANAGQFTARGIINAGGAFSQSGTGTNSLSRNIIAADGIAFNAAVQLAANVALTTTDGDVTFGSTLNSDTASSVRTLTITAGAGDVLFDGAVGATGPLGAVTLVSAGDVTFTDTLDAASFMQSAAASTGETKFGGITTLDGAFGFTGNKLTINAALTTGGDVAIANAGLFKTGTNGDIDVTGSFTQSGAGTNSLAADITATDDISFAKAITLLDAVTLTTTDKDVSFGDTVNGGFALDVSVGSGRQHGW
ncbi:MAG: hypothetical protein EBS21_06890, partial [Sphingomonadaceae bacterium]|nr:hypothetical protein [Sphingomonadaceae bacterium]